MEVTQLHASCVAINGKGVLLIGESGTGKSDLALRLIDRGAVLVADDQVQCVREAEVIFASAPEASAPENIKGLLEVRGLGIFTLPVRGKVIISLAVSLELAAKVERLPSPEHYPLMNIKVPLIHLNGREASSPIKVEMALNALEDNTMQVGAFRK